MVMVLVRGLAVLVGIAVIASTLRSAIQVFVLPRGVSDRIARFVFLTLRAVFELRVARVKTYDERDSIMALYAPLALLTLIGAWLALVYLGYTLIYWGLGVGPFTECLILSGSSLFTLGFAPVPGAGYNLVVFTEAGTGLLLLAMVITYLPTIYGAWSRREQAVALLEVRAGSPPSAWEMITRIHRIRGLEKMDDIWPTWETWFIDLEESHTSLSSVVFFRSPQPDRSWVTAAGVILDVAALMSSAVDGPRDPQRQLALRAGYIALRRIASLFRLPFNPDPAPTDPISIAPDEFFDVYDELAAAGVPMRPDREQAWRDFAGWRVNYDAVLLELATLTMAPYAPWISDRSLRWQHPALSAWARLRTRLAPGRNVQ